MSKATWKFWDVTVRGYDPVTIQAPSRGKATAAAWRKYRAADADCSFKAFLQMSSVRKGAAPSGDPYTYIREYYGLILHPGDEVTTDTSGRKGTVMWPDGNTHHAHVLLEGDDHPCLVHPLDIKHPKSEAA